MALRDLGSSILPSRLQIMGSTSRTASRAGWERPEANRAFPSRSNDSSRTALRKAGSGSGFWAAGGANALSSGVIQVTPPCQTESNLQPIRNHYRNRPEFFTLTHRHVYGYVYTERINLLQMGW